MSQNQLVKSKLQTLFAFFALFFYACVSFAQVPEWNDPNSLPIWMTPEEEARKHEIGQGFLKSAALTGEVRNVAEFERMEGVLVRYPLGLPVSFIATLSKHTIVYTLVSTSSNENSARTAYQNAGATMANCKFIRAATDSYWTRDYGPWYVVNESNQMCITDFPYDRPRANDDAVNAILGTYLDIPVYNLPVVHTGGNYMTDGWGISASTDLVYEENDDDSTWVKQQMEDYLGISTYHVTIDPLGDYIKHIDCWGKFLDVDKVLITQVPTTNSNYAKYEQVASYFASQISAYGTPFQVFRVSSPGGQPYTNSLILNDRVYVPIMSSTPSSTDNAALEVYRQAMPGYTVTGIYYNSWQSTDALHCRAMGMADRQMLYIKHLPLTGLKPFQPEFTVTADIIPLSGQALKTDSLFLIYKTNVRDWDTLLLTGTGGTQYGAMLPVIPGDSLVSYYLFAADQSGHREKHPFIGRPDPHVFTVSEPPLLPDLTSTLTVTPNVMNGETSFNVVVKVSELNSTQASGEITVVIPKDSRWSADGAFDPSLDHLEEITVQNREWSCTSGDPDYYIFHFSGTLPAGGQSSFGFKARFIPGNTRGKCTVTSQIVSGSGGENRETNNSDSESISYFAK